MQPAIGAAGRTGSRPDSFLTAPWSPAGSPGRRPCWSRVVPMVNEYAEGFPALIAFDLDDTLAPSKSPLPAAMGATMRDLLAVRPVCIISGGQFGQFKTQVLDRLPADTDLSGLHLMPTCGTRYMRFVDGAWRELYAHDLEPAQRRAAIESIERRAAELGLWEPDEAVAGDRIEDRGSQITYSALGQEAAVDDKKAWDPDGAKREALREAIAADLPTLEVRAGGSTSIDITRHGIDKAYGIEQLAGQTGIALGDMLFVGDRLAPGGNDYPVRTLDVPCHQVADHDETLAYLNRLIPVLAAGDTPGAELLDLLEPLA
ncbi:phosphomannomutase [Propionibacterium ruminifibrarum]|uniref:phosphomannomutase n=2 Tax=Propionibacterium ruminifibrarum TaxID=1962131 RepID=A0A375I488_9ACTN|nr:phosphomannomutase [Propionibacterium ruminifibrarum]